MPDGYGKPLHFTGEKPEPGLGQHAAYEQLHHATGKTIERVRFGDDLSSDPEVHNGEYIVLEFVDGTALQILSGSNGQNLMREHPGLKASEINCSFVAVFKSDGKTSR